MDLVHGNIRGVCFAPTNSNNTVLTRPTRQWQLPKVMTSARLTAWEPADPVMTDDLPGLTGRFSDDKRRCCRQGKGQPRGNRVRAKCQKDVQQFSRWVWELASTVYLELLERASYKLAWGSHHRSCDGAVVNDPNPTW